MHDNLDEIKSCKYLCGVGVIESSSDQTPVDSLIPCCRRESRDTDLISKMVFFGFMAALFLADSPIKRSLSVKETKDGVVKLPCSLATGDIEQYKSRLSKPNLRNRFSGRGGIRTDLNIGSLVYSNTRVCGSCAR